MKKIILIAIVAAFVLPMFIKGPDGEPIMSLSDWVPSTPDVNLPSVGSGSSESQQSYYRYRDASGNWQYSDTVPAGAEYEVLDVDTNANIIQATQTSEPEPEADPTISTPAPGVAGYVENMQNVMQDAEAIQGVMDDRSSQLEKQLRNAQ